VFAVLTDKGRTCRLGVPDHVPWALLMIQTEKPLRHSSILVVDDNDAVRKITRLFLETQLDFEICGEAVDGVDAIEKAQKLKPDLIVLDLAMPRMNGVEAASVIKGMMPNVQIVLFTLYKESLGSALISTLGIDAVFSKPDGAWKLVECVRGLLQRA
jgi:DNA-binding NarL/FixJ family response regulator